MPKVREYDIAPGSELLKRLGRSASKRPREVLDPAHVPEGLRHLIPLAEHWGVSCDVTRHAVTDAATDAELSTLSSALKGHHSAIHDWFYSFREGDPQPNEVSAFRSMLIAEMEAADGPGIPGYLDWAFSNYKRQRTSPEALERLRHAYEFATRAKILRWYDASDLSEIEAALGIEQRRGGA